MNTSANEFVTITCLMCQTDFKFKLNSGHETDQTIDLESETGYCSGCSIKCRFVTTIVKPNTQTCRNILALCAGFVTQKIWMF